MFSDSDSFTYSPSILKQLEQQNAILEEENKQLRATSYLKGELEKTRTELIRMTSLKEQFEEKYNEMAVKCMYLEIEDSMIYDENEQITLLNKKIEMLMHANEDLRKEAKKSKEEALKYQMENVRLLEDLERYRKEAYKLKENKGQKEKAVKGNDKPSVPEMQHVIVSEERVEPCEYPNKSPSPRIEPKKSKQAVTVRKSAPVQITTQPTFNFALSSPKFCATPTVSALSPRQKASPIRTATNQHAKSQYLPSFLRSKRIIRKDKKPTPRNSNGSTQFEMPVD
ncbi:unnamed protein product [Blepharisma stoltei]|uniref:Uncharacterized protein n=1 Tax=Blepharisma stoltei TaxID=1481888 RepID=A0AAU9K564_9CILI|nr:unnamed protein product [Blepharisma stoltei]